MRCRQVGIVAPEYVLQQSQAQGFIIGRPAPAGGVTQVADAFGGGHQQGAGAAGRVADAQVGDGVGGAPVGILFPNRQRGQQYGGGGGSVIGTVVAGGVQHPVKDAPQQVVAQAGDFFRYLGDYPRQIADGQAIVDAGG